MSKGVGPDATDPRHRCLIVNMNLAKRASVRETLAHHKTQCSMRRFAARGTFPLSRLQARTWIMLRAQLALWVLTSRQMALRCASIANLASTLMQQEPQCEFVFHLPAQLCFVRSFMLDHLTSSFQSIPLHPIANWQLQELPGWAGVSRGQRGNHRLCIILGRLRDKQRL